MVHRFLDRMDNTRSLDEAFVPFLEEHGFLVFPFGQTTLLSGSPILACLKRLLVKHYAITDYGAGFMLKFAPDYICLHQNNKSEPFFLDTKASVIPILFNSALEGLRAAAAKAGCTPLNRGDVGVVEREAWDVYNRFFPKTRVAICFAAPYSPQLLSMEWCSKTCTFYRFVDNRNEKAGGSGTPHVNIHLGRMRTPDAFLRQEFGTTVDADAYAALVDVVKKWPVQKPNGTVNWTQFTNALKRMRTEGTPWIEGQMPEHIRELYFGEKPLFKI